MKKIIIRAKSAEQAKRMVKGMFELLNEDPSNPSYLLELGKQIDVDLWEVYSNSPGGL